MYQTSASVGNKLFSTKCINYTVIMKEFETRSAVSKPSARESDIESDIEFNVCKLVQLHFRATWFSDWCSIQSLKIRNELGM